MLTPIAACTDDADRLFVADSNAQLVHVFNLATRQYATWQPPKGQPAFSQPVGIAWDALHSRLLVSDSVASAVYTFDTRGQFTARIGDGILRRPVGIAVEPAPPAACSSPIPASTRCSSSRTPGSFNRASAPRRRPGRIQLSHLPRL